MGELLMRRVLLLLVLIAGCDTLNCYYYVACENGVSVQVALWSCENDAEAAAARACQVHGGVVP